MEGNLVRKIVSRTASLVVVGLGHVGLPTAAMFARAGFNVIGVDINEQVVKMVAAERSHIKELDELVGKVVKCGKLKTTTDVLHAVSEVDIVMICVQTPLTRSRKPDLTVLREACESVAKGLSRGKLVIIVSTVPPGTTRSYVAPLLERISGLKCGTEFWLAHCPERIVLGKVMQEFVENTRVVGGYDEESGKIAAELFKTMSKGEIVVTDCTCAELAKLAENTFRDVNIALANELALICGRLGSDVMEVISLANTHPRVSIHKPGCGVGGPCLPKDPYLLLHPAKEKGFKSIVIEPCRKLNDYMSKHAVELAVKALKNVGKDVHNSTVTVLGVAYKGEVDEARNSSAEKIVRELMDLGAEVVVYDPYCEESFGARRAEDVNGAVRGADCVMIATDHKMFEVLELEKIRALMNENPTLIDGRRIVHPIDAENQGFVYYGIGYGVE